MAQAALLSASKCLNHCFSWFQLVKFRLTIIIVSSPINNVRSDAAATADRNRTGDAAIEGSARRVLFKGDPQTRASRLREALKGVRRWTHRSALLDARDV
jgi:hypothetical protein